MPRNRALGDAAWRPATGGLLAMCLGVALLLLPLAANGGQSLAEWDVRADGSRILNLVVHETPRPVPTVRFVDGEGRYRSLDEFRGKVTAVHFWATWCGPCRGEMPTVDYLQREIGEKHLAFLPLSLDRAGPEVVKAFYADMGVENLPVYMDGSMEIAQTLGVNGIPYTIFLNREGMEIARVLGDRDWSQPETVDLIRKLVAM